MTFREAIKLLSWFQNGTYWGIKYRMLNPISTADLIEAYNVVVKENAK